MCTTHCVCVCILRTSMYIVHALLCIAYICNAFITLLVTLIIKVSYLSTVVLSTQCSSVQPVNLL